MTQQPKYIRYHSHAGYLVRGDHQVDLPNPTRHMEAAACLTAQLECGQWGTAQSYDGAGMSAGLLHHIAVSPATLEQGSLWGLLDKIQGADVGAFTAYAPLRAAMLPWTVSTHGVLLDAAGGKVTGAAIRRRFNGTPDGITPPGDDVAKSWVVMFGALMADQRTHQAQIDYAINWLVKSQQETEARVYLRYWRVISTTGGDPNSPGSLVLGSLARNAVEPAVDLAMCVYHAFSANGPAPARDLLVKAFSHRPAPNDGHAFAKELVRSFGLSNFGRWHDDPRDQGSRYDATRSAAVRLGYWPKELVDEIMPRNIT